MICLRGLHLLKLIHAIKDAQRVSRTEERLLDELGTCWNKCRVSVVHQFEAFDARFVAWDNAAFPAIMNSVNENFYIAYVLSS